MRSPSSGRTFVLFLTGSDTFVRIRSTKAGGASPSGDVTCEEPAFERQAPSLTDGAALRDARSAAMAGGDFGPSVSTVTGRIPFDLPPSPSLDGSGSVHRDDGTYRGLPAA